MSRRVAIFGTVLLLAFVGITAWRWFEAASPVDSPETTVGDLERQQTAAFWQTYRLATDHRVAGRIREAAEEYERALEIDPDHQDALYYLGNMYVELEKYDGAREKWEHMISVNPQSARGYARLGDLFFCLGDVYVVDLDRADSAYREAHEINREETGHLLRLGEVALAFRDASDARARFQDVLISDPANADATFFLAYLDWSGGRRADAIERLERGRVSDVAAAPEGMTGEGDTRSKERQFERAGCSDLHDVVTGLDSVPGERLLQEAERRFEALDEWLERRRATPVRPAAAASPAPAPPRDGS